MKIATYNVRLDTAADKQWRWLQRKKHVLNLIKYHNWQLFSVQELLPNQAKDLQELKEYSSLIAERDGDGNGEGLGIFYQKDLFSVIDTHYFWLSETPDKPSIHPEAGCPRIALWGIFQEKKTEKEFLVVNVHLDHISAAARKEGLSVLLKQLEKKIAEYPTILMGDFNAEIEESVHELISEEFTDAKRKGRQKHYGPMGSFQDFDYDREWEALEEIDYIYTKDFSINKTAILTDSCNCRFPSDHFPLEAEILF